jgi:hypothetical protein
MYSDDVQIREVAGGYVGSRSREVSLSDLEERVAERLAAVRESCANVEAAAARESAAQAADAAASERRYRELLHGHGRGASGRAVGSALEGAIFGQGTPVREAVHPLGRVITGPHSHGSVRHSHPRLPLDHLHCPSCGGDSRLCLDNPHHEPGAIPARESNAAADTNPWVAAMNGIYDGRPSRITPGQAMGELWQLEQAGQQGSEHGSKHLATGFERLLFER